MATADMNFQNNRGMLGGIGERVSDIYEKLSHAVIFGLALLMTRIGVGLIFWKSGHTKVDGDYNVTDITVLLFREEYKVPVIPAELAATLATYMELAMPLLIWAGLATRLSALALFGMTFVIQFFVYPNLWHDHIFWAGALLILIAKGPGLFSLDQFVGPILTGRKR